MIASGTFPKVSIVMPTYNRAEFIGETIESIRRQTYTNWELIIVDDGSDDNTEGIIVKTGDDRIQFYKAGRIGIASKIKNIGLEKVTGDLIAFMDSDDLWAETKLEKQLRALEQYPDAGFSLTGGYNFRALTKPVEFFYEKKEGLKYGDIFISFFKSEVAATIPTLVLRKQCIKVIGGFKDTGSHCDLDFILNLARNFKAIILYEPLFYRRLHETNDSSINWIERQYEGLEMIRSYKKSLPADVVTDSFFKAYINFGEKYLRFKETGKAISQFFKAWKYKPFSIVPLKKTLKAVLYSFKK